MDIKRIVIYSFLFVLITALASQGFTQLGLVIPLIITFVYFTAIFIYAQILKNNSIVDIGWGMGFVIGSWVTLLTTESPTLLSYLVVAFITVWGVRLSVRLFKRNWGRPEDFRYAQWREEWGKNVVITAFFRVFMIQALINFIVGSAAYSTIRYNTFSGGIDSIFVYGGLLIALIGLYFEVVGDEQLRKNIEENKRKGTKTLIQTGLWSITRHPNYFGEILIWVGLYLVGFTLLITQAVHPLYYGLLIISPLLMSIVLIKISTPLLEKNMEKYAGWDEYAKRVPMIFPGFKK